MMLKAEDWNSLILKLNDQYILPEGLIMAIILTESAGNPWVMRYESGWKYLVEPEVWAHRLGQTVETETRQQKFSYGLCQIMGSLLRELGFSKELSRCIDPAISIEYCAKFLAQLFKRYPQNIDDVIASYNAGSPRKNEHGECVNQEYVDKVKSFMLRIKT